MDTCYVNSEGVQRIEEQDHNKFLPGSVYLFGWTVFLSVYIYKNKTMKSVKANIDPYILT